LEALAGQEAQKFAGIPDVLLKKEKELKSDITSYTGKLNSAKTTDSTMIRQISNNLFRCNRSYDSLTSVFENQFPKYFDLKYNTKPVTLDMLRATALRNKHSAIISFNVGDSMITIFTLTKKNFDIQHFNKPAKFNETIQLYRSSLRNANSSTFYKVYQRLGYELYQLLFPKILLTKEYQSIDNLIVIPDATISTIPFETLLTDSTNLAGFENQQGFGRLPYLIEKYAVSYSYSANLLYRTFRRNAPRGAFPQNIPEITDLDDWLAIAPVFDNNQTGSMCLRTREMLRSTVENDSLTREYFNGNQIIALPGTETEVNAIFNQYQSQSKKAMILLHQRANKSFVMSDSISKFKIIHFATHGFVNSQKPEYSGLLLAQDSLLEENGMLTNSEIYNLKLNSELVVLSACETGLGKIVKGEGIIGLTRALLYAGTKNIIVSLWKVSDASTSELMENFYAELLKSARFSKPRGFSNPLQQAKLKMILEGKYAHPFYWSPFILVGR